MNVWKDTALLGIYTLTPTHFGTGQTIGAIDLPIARDASTDFPVLPATGLKGVIRDYLGVANVEKKLLDNLFGKSLEESNEANALEAGRLAFTEARLVAYPVRSLNRPFLHVTCRLILERLARDLRALGREDFLPAISTLPTDVPEIRVLTADSGLANQTLVLEDLVYPANDITGSSALQDFGKRLAELIPATEEDTRKRLIEGLVLIPDQDFSALMKWVIPVQARIKLTGGKTTDKWRNPETNAEESGNLWYEEHLPADCLFIAFVGERRQRTFAQGAHSVNDGYGLTNLTDNAKHLQIVQLGGNETVGQGLCYCTLLPSSTLGILEAFA